MEGGKRHSDMGPVSPSLVAAPEPSSLSQSIQVPPSPPLSPQIPPGKSPPEKNCAQLLGPLGAEGDYDHLSCGELHNVRRRRGYARKNPKAALETRLAAMDAVGRNRNREMADAVYSAGKSSAIQGKAAALMTST